MRANPKQADQQRGTFPMLLKKAKPTCDTTVKRVIYIIFEKILTVFRPHPSLFNKTQS